LKMLLDRAEIAVEYGDKVFTKEWREVAAIGARIIPRSVLTLGRALAPRLAKSMDRLEGVTMTCSFAFQAGQLLRSDRD